MADEEAWKEPDVTINGVRLTKGQAMTVRVALESFALDLSEGLGDDEMGQKICEGYKGQIESIRRIIFGASR